MAPIDQAVVIAAGCGSRLRAHGSAPKSLFEVHGRPVLRRLLDHFEAVGLRRLCLVVGYRADELERAVTAWRPALELSLVSNPRWRLKNGVSVLAAEQAVGREPFLLSMADHLFDRAVIEQARGVVAPTGGATLMVDRKIDAIFDLDDATKVLLEGRSIRAIGKDLLHYNAIDTGLFACTAGVFDALHRAADRRGGDCSLSDGMLSLAERGLFEAADIGDAWWQDVDTPEMYAEARAHYERALARRSV